MARISSFSCDPAMPLQRCGTRRWLLFSGRNHKGALRPPRLETAVAGWCWASRKLPTAAANDDIFTNPASGLSLQVFAIPPTQ